MAKIKNVSGDDRLVPGLGGRVVFDGQEVEVPESDVFSYTCQSTIWRAADESAQDAHDAVTASEPVTEGDASDHSENEGAAQ